MKLYSISEETISSIIEHNCRQQSFADGKYEVIGEDSFTQYGYPIKVVFYQKQGKITVITTYPLKKGLKK